MSEQFGELRDPNGRRSAAEALADVTGDWLIDYASRAIVEEEAGERVRTSLDEYRTR